MVLDVTFTVKIVNYLTREWLQLFMEHPQVQREIRTRFINRSTHKRKLAACIALSISATTNAGFAHGRLADL